MLTRPRHGWYLRKFENIFIRALFLKYSATEHGDGIINNTHPGLYHFNFKTSTRLDIKACSLNFFIESDIDWLTGGGVADPPLEQDHPGQAVLDEEEEGVIQSEISQSNFPL